MHLSPDDIIFWQQGFLKLNATIAITWGLMFVLVAGSILVTRNLSTGLQRSRWQNLLEIVVTAIKEQIAEVGLHQPEKYLGFLGTLFLFVAIASVFTIIPGYQPPTGSLSTTVALAICVFVAVPLFGIEDRGLGGYLRVYLKPTVIMLPFNIISELSRTLALAGFDTLPEQASARYPQISLEEPWMARADLVLLSSEPYRFRDKHIAELAVLPVFRGKRVCLVDGEMTSWYGSRAIDGLQYLTRFRGASGFTR